MTTADAGSEYAETITLHRTSKSYNHYIMFELLVVLTILAAVLLICVVLVQKSKGGGLSSTFAGSNQIMGVRRTNSFIENLTWTLAGIIALLSVLSSYCIPGSVANTSRVKAVAPVEQTGGNYDSQAPANVEEAVPVAIEGVAED